MDPLGQEKNKKFTTTYKLFFMDLTKCSKLKKTKTKTKTTKHLGESKENIPHSSGLEEGYMSHCGKNTDILPPYHPKGTIALGWEGRTNTVALRALVKTNSVWRKK